MLYFPVHKVYLMTFWYWYLMCLLCFQGGLVGWDGRGHSGGWRNTGSFFTEEGRKLVKLNPAEALPICLGHWGTSGLSGLTPPPFILSWDWAYFLISYCSTGAACFSNACHVCCLQNKTQGSKSNFWSWFSMFTHLHCCFLLNSWPLT